MSGLAGLARHEQYFNEEVSSDFRYAKRYKIKPIEHQVTILQQIFPEIRQATFDGGIAK